MIRLQTCYDVTCDKCGQVVPVDRDYLTSFDDDRDTAHYPTEAGALAALGKELAGIQLAAGALPGWPAGTTLDAKCLAEELCKLDGCNWEPWTDTVAGASAAALRMCQRPFCGAVQQRTPDGVESLLELTT